MSKFNVVFIVLFVLFASFMLVCPETAKNGAISGLLICSNVIIPTLFPFTFCVLFITNAVNTEKAVHLGKITYFIFGLNLDEFLIFLLSLIGGYPTGAKLIEKHFYGLNTDSYKPNLMLCYCVNAGPAFIVMAVGTGILNSEKSGWLLLFAHIFSSFILAVLLKPLCIKQISTTTDKNIYIPITDNFIMSAKSAANSTFSVCIYVVLFSVINVFFEHINSYIPFFKNISSLMEVTTAVSDSNNLYQIAFLLGFSGVCVWCQILGLIKSFKVNLPCFITARVLQGILSTFMMFLMLKIFKISIPTFSNSVAFKTQFIYRSIPLSISLVILGLLFVVSTLPTSRDKLKQKI